jgi:multiple sugar transport system permease protein
MFLLGQVLTRGEQGKRVLFVLPAALFVISMVVFRCCSGWSSRFPIEPFVAHRAENGVDNLVQMWGDPFYWNALLMVWYVLAIIVEYYRLWSSPCC